MLAPAISDHAFLKVFFERVETEQRLEFKKKGRRHISTRKRALSRENRKGKIFKGRKVCLLFLRDSRDWFSTQFIVSVGDYLL